MATFAGRVIVILGILVAASTHTFGGSSPDYPMADYPTPERYLAEGKINQYVDKAERYIASNRDSLYTPRVCWDMAMLGKVIGEDLLTLHGRAVLLLVYPQSLEGRYMLQTFTDAAEFRQFAWDLVDRHMIESPIDLKRNFLHLVRSGLHLYGADVLSDDGLAMYCAMLARDAGDDALFKLCRNAILNRVHTSPIQSAALGQALRDDASDANRVENLHATKLASFRPSEEFLLSKMSVGDRLALLDTEIDDDIADRKYAHVASLLSGLLTDHMGARRLYMRGVCEIARGNLTGGSDDLSKMDKFYAASPWTKPAREFLAAVRGAKDMFEPMSSRARKVFLQLRRRRGPLEFSGVYTSPLSVPLNVYLLVIPDGEFELQISRYSQLLLAYRTTATNSSIYLISQGVRHEFDSGGMIPALRFHLPLEPNHHGHVDIGLSVADLTDGNESPWRVLDCPIFAGHDSFMDFLQNQQTVGTLPAQPIKEKDASTTYGLISARFDAPVLDKIEVTIAADDSVKSLSIKQKDWSLEVHDIRYGPAGSFKPHTPAWPDVKAMHEGQFDSVALEKFLRAMDNAGIPVQRQQAANKFSVQ